MRSEGGSMAVPLCLSPYENRALAGSPCSLLVSGREGAPMAETETDLVIEALRTVADPCCRERGISVVDMGLLRDVWVDAGEAHVELLLTSGWCPFQLNLVEEVAAAAESVPGVEHASVRISLDQVWSTERLSADARRKLRFLPEPGEVTDRDRYVARPMLPSLLSPPIERP
ncbi:MAG: DUF59 domain-containing protein [Nitriliruptorales bacterium]|nr:DUF59 domain-containing protein [Nitriliruptorales bacterium]